MRILPFTWTQTNSVDKGRAVVLTLHPSPTQAVDVVMRKSQDTVLFICLKKLHWNWEAFQTVQKYFDKVHLITWDEDENDLLLIHEALESLEYDYLISHWSMYFIQPNEIRAAKKGAINFHPGPKEHPGAGSISYVYTFPEKRSHHGVTVHEVNEKLDNGRIYYSTRYPCFGMSPEDVGRCAIIESLELLDRVACKLSTGLPTSALAEEGQGRELQWGDHFFTRKQEEQWLKNLPAFHIAHRSWGRELVETVNRSNYFHYRNAFDEYLEGSCMKLV